MHPNAQAIQTFYTCFQSLDDAGMKKCYHPEVEFSDPVFPALRGNEVGSMWAMLIGNLKNSEGDWRCEVNNIHANETEGSCRWGAHYTFSGTGRPVHNNIDAQFQFRDGLIVRHSDSFDFYLWARMAFGLKGMLMGWAPFFKAKVQLAVKDRLSRFMLRD